MGEPTASEFGNLSTPSPSIPSAILLPVNHAAIVCAFIASIGGAACGARSQLLVGAPAVLDAALDVRERDAPASDGTDVPPDVPIVCPDLRLATGPIAALTVAGGSFATPRIVSRSAGFDVVAPLSNSDPIGIRGRRMTVSEAPVSLSFGEMRIVGEDSWTWAEAGSDGSHLALCFMAGGPTLRIWSDAFTSVSSTVTMLPTGVGTCRGVAWAGDRWVSAWHDYGGPSYVLDQRFDGSTIAPARSASVSLADATPSLVAYGHGAAWGAYASDTRSIRIVFESGAGRDIRRDFAVVGSVHSLRFAAWPRDPASVFVTWRDASSAVHRMIAREDGSSVPDAMIVPSPGESQIRGLEVAPFLDGVVVADLACGDANPTEGRVALHRIDASGNEMGRGAQVPLDCRGSVSLPSIAANARDVAIVWLTSRSGPLLDNDVDVAVFRCAP